MNSNEPSSAPVTLLLSGGIDSSVLLHYLVKKLNIQSVIALTFVYGQRHQQEVEAARKQVATLAGKIKEHLILDFSMCEQIIGGSSALLRHGQEVPELSQIPDEQRQQPPTYVANRNMIFLSLGAALAESRGSNPVYYGAQTQDEYGYWDCTPEFVARLNDVLQLNRQQTIKIEAPFLEFHKSEIIKLGTELEVDFSATWTCYRGENRPCKVCPTCVERRIAFHEAGERDPLG